MPRPSRTLRGAWIAEVENASSAAYLGLLLRVFDHHIAWDHIKSPMFHKITNSNSFDGKHRNINFRELEIVEKRFAKWPTTGTVLAQYRLERIQKDGVEDDGWKENSPTKDSPPKMKVEKSAEEKNEGAEDAAMPIKEKKDDEEASAHLVEE